MSTVCVIGAGAAGLVSMKTCIEQQLKPTCYELNDNIGGLWDYSNNVRYKQGAAVYKNLTANTPANFMAFSDFPFPKNSPIFPSHEHYLRYLHDYAKNYSLYDYIAFNTEVVHVNYDSNEGKWRVETRHVMKQETRSENDNEHHETHTSFFDFVLLCTGILRTPFIPDFKGLHKFKGTIMHSSMFRDGGDFRGQKVIVIGGGNSAGDVACEISKCCSQMVYLCCRKGLWLVPRYWYPGMQSFVAKAVSRFQVYLRDLVPNWLYNRITDKIFNANIDHKGFGLNPKYSYAESSEVMVSDDLIPLIGNGRIQYISEGIEKLKAQEVMLTNGQLIPNVDTIICATGYRCDFSLVDQKVFGGPTFHDTMLYQNMWPIDVHATNVCGGSSGGKNSLAVIGAVSTDGAVPAVQELQARWAVLVFLGQRSLPSIAQMEKWVQKSRKQKKKQTDSALMRMPFIRYKDFLARQVGCFPSPWAVFKKYRSLWLVYHLIFGPHMSFEYRLVGPNSWDSAYEMYKYHHGSVKFMHYF